MAYQNFTNAVPQAGSIGGSSVTLNPCPPSPQNIHSSTRAICERLASLASSYESLIQRISGPRPVANEAQTKEQREPSTLEFVDIAHRLLSTLESQYQDLASSIG